MFFDIYHDSTIFLDMYIDNTLVLETVMIPNDSNFYTYKNGATIVFWTCTNVVQCFWTFTMVLDTYHGTTVALYM